MKIRGVHEAKREPPPPWGGGGGCQNHEIKEIHETKENVNKHHEIKGETVENLLNLTQVY